VKTRRGAGPPPASSAAPRSPNAAHPRESDNAAASAPSPAATDAAETPARPAPAVAAKPQQEPDEGYVAVGRVLGPFGLKGELKVQPLSDNPDRFRPKARLWAAQQPVTVVDARDAQGYVYITLKGFRDRDSVDKFRHALLQVPEADLAPLPEGEYYRFQLIGLEVVTKDGAPLGTLDEIIETGANDVYRVHPAEGADVLLPALDDVIISVDLDAKRMVVDPPEWR
jgi:16S rRNA processing protein RimM